MKPKEYYEDLMASIPQIQHRDLVEIVVIGPNASSHDVIRRAAPMPQNEMREWMSAGFTVVTTYEVVDISSELRRRVEFERITNEMRMDALTDVGLHRHPLVESLVKAAFSNPLALRLGITHRLEARVNEMQVHVALMDVVLDYDNPDDCQMFNEKLESLYPLGFSRHRFS